MVNPTDSKTNNRNREKLETCEIRKVCNIKATTRANACEKTIGKKHLSIKSHCNSSVFLVAWALSDSRLFIFQRKTKQEKNITFTLPLAKLKSLLLLSHRLQIDSRYSLCGITNPRSRLWSRAFVLLVSSSVILITNERQLAKIRTERLTLKCIYSHNGAIRK